MRRGFSHVRVGAWAAGVVLCACGPTPPAPGDAGGTDAGDEAVVDEDVFAPDVADAAAEPETGSDAGVEDVGAGEDGSGGDADGEADAPEPDGAGDDAPPDQGTDGQVSLTCGDAIRDPESEECDDGLGSAPTDRACDQSCVVQEGLVAASTADSRWLSAGPHGVAAGPTGYAVAFMELLPSDAGGDVEVGVAVFSATGERVGVAYVPGAPFEADPVLAALPDGSFALAIASDSVDGDGLGIGVYHVAADASEPMFVGAANTTAMYRQHSPDMTWDGQRLVVSWSDDSPSWELNASGRRFCARTYAGDLSAIDNQEACDPESATLPSRRVIAGRNGLIAGAWREESAPGDLFAEYLVVAGDSWTVRSSMATAAPASDAPAVAWLDDTKILAVHSDGSGTLLGVVVSSGGDKIWGPEAVLAAGSIGFQPTLAATHDGVYLAWAQPSSVDDASLPWEATLDETSIRKLVWTGTGFDPSPATLPLPRHVAHQAGDQTRPMLGASSTTLAAAWNDMTTDNYPSSSPHGEVVLELIPTPILRGPAP